MNADTRAPRHVALARAIRRRLMDDRTTRKTYSVVLSKSGASELGGFLSRFMRKSEGVTYFNCKAIDAKGHYFHMVIEDATAKGAPVDFEVQIPHSFVIAIAHAADMKRMGFLSDP
jgi:hypothetical protein